jgi:hypothetical protein
MFILSYFLEISGNEVVSEVVGVFGSELLPQLDSYLLN